MQFNFQTLGKALAGMLKKKPQPEYGLDPNAGRVSGEVVPSVPIPQSPVIPATVGASPEVADLMRDYRQANQTLMEPPPVRGEDQIDPIEAALAAFAGSGFKSPGIQSRISGIPQALAKARGDYAYGGQVGAYEARQSGAETQARLSAQLVNAYLDRDAITAKIEADAKNKAMAEATKQAVAMARTNAQIGMKILQLDGEGKLNAPALASVLTMNGMAAPEQAQAVAEGMIQDMRANPNAWMGLQQAKQQLDEEKFARDQTEQDEKTIDSVDAPFSRRLAAIGRLQASGRLPANADPVALANELSLKAQEMQAQISMTEARTKLLDEELRFLPTEQAMKVASHKAQLQHIRNQDNLARDKFDFEKIESNRKLKIDAYKGALGGYQSAYGNLTNEINSVRVSRRDWESVMAESKPGSDTYNQAKAEVDAYSTKLLSLTQQRDAIHQQANALRSEMVGDGIDPSEVSKPHQGGVGEGPAAAPAKEQASGSKPSGGASSKMIQLTQGGRTFTLSVQDIYNRAKQAIKNGKDKAAVIAEYERLSGAKWPG